MSAVIASLHALLETVPVASLAVRAGDDAEVSLVPFVLAREPLRFVLFVSELAAHTASLRAAGRCALMVHRGPTEGDSRDHHAIERVIVRAAARFLSREEAEALGHAARWREAFPHVAPMVLGLKDFHFVELTPERDASTFIQGFGRAYRVLGASLDAVEHVSAR